jgi:predicted metal-binding membrane protein
LSSTADEAAQQQRPRRIAASAAGPRWSVPIIGLVAAAAWATLWLWAASPYGRYLDHGRWTEIGIAGVICRAVPAGGVIVPALLYAGGWLLMTAAMMLPSTLPLLYRFERLVEARRERGQLLALLIAGYFLAWAGFGVAAHVLDMGLHAAAREVGWLAANGWMLGAAVLAAAGLFQFSRLKYRCLARCRTPLSFLAHHWRGPTPRRSSFRLGLDHGVFCVGCCWAIMLLMFVVGTGNLGWMLGLGAVMALEKNAPWGQRLISRPLGATLLAAAAAIVAANLSWP